ncbi:MAG: sulfite exporter TauE/SafE family protein [Hasllibacter sp.]
MDDLTLGLFAACAAITLFAGFVKGAVGFAMPLIMVSGISSILDPKTAVALMILPVVATNVAQTLRTGYAPAIRAVRAHRLYVGIVCVSILLVAQLLPRVDTRALYFVLGVPVTVLTALQLAGWRPRIAPARRRAAEVVAGLISGAMGGMAGTWGPTTVLYLLALDVPKRDSVVVQGVIYGTGAVALFVAHLFSGILNAQSAPWSAALLVPGLLGIWLGFRVQDRMDQAAFRRATLVVLVVAGLNLIRRGLGW